MRDDFDRLEGRISRLRARLDLLRVYAFRKGSVAADMRADAIARKIERLERRIGFHS